MEEDVLFDLLFQRLHELISTNGLDKKIERVYEETNEETKEENEETKKWTIVVTSRSKGDECFTISEKTYDTLNLDFLSKCGGATGDVNIRLIIDASWDVGYKRIELIDSSAIIKEFPSGEEILISNKKLNILIKGDTWYGKHGFVNDVMTEKRGAIIEFINLTTHQLMSTLKDSAKIKIKQSLTKFNEFNGVDENDETMTIKEIFSSIQTQFKGPVLDEDYEKFEFYVKFMQNVYRELLTNLGLLRDPFDGFVLMNPNLDLNLTSKIGGGRKKRRTTRRKKKSGKKRKSRRR